MMYGSNTPRQTADSVVPTISTSNFGAALVDQEEGESEELRERRNCLKCVFYSPLNNPSF